MSPRTLLPSLALGLSLAPNPASASQCHEVPFARLLRDADVVFVGRALTWNAELATTFEVERVYKGSVAARVIVESGAVKYAALAPPDRYLVLAVRDAPGTRPGNLYVHTCGGSQRLLAATDVPKELGDGTAPPSDGSPPPPITGVTLPSAPEPTPAPPPSSVEAPLAPPPSSVEAPPAPPPAGCASCSLTPSAPPLVLLPVIAWAARTRRRGSYVVTARRDTPPAARRRLPRGR